MTLLILIGLLVLVCVCAVRGGGSILLSRRSRKRPGGRPVLYGLGVVLSGLGLAIGTPAGLPVPIGYAGLEGGLSLDPLCCLFLLLVFVVAGFADVMADGEPISAGWRDLAVAGTVLAMLAGDAFLLACGSVLAMLALGVCAGGRTLRVHAAAGACLAAACALLSQSAAPIGALLGDPGYSVLRANAGAGSWLLPALSVAGVMPLLGLWPAQARFCRLCGFAPVWVPNLAGLLGLFLLVRLLLDLAGPVPSAGWGAALAVLGIGSALQGGVAGLSHSRAGGAIGSVVLVQNGLAVAGIGLCLLAKAEDLPVLAGSALDSVLLLLPVLSLAGLAALSLTRAIEAEAGSGLMARLGGLVQSMPSACLLMALPLMLLGFVPPAGGFAALWLLLQSALWMPLAPIAGVPVSTALLVAGMAMAAGLAAAGLVRVVWVVALGRPRTPRGAAATDLDRRMLRWHGGLLVVPLLSAMVPGGWLRMAAGPQGWLGADALPHPLLLVSAPGGTARLFPLPTLLVIALVSVLVAGAVRRLAPVAERREAAWEGGAPPPPPWLPFGDPVTQIAPASLDAGLRHALGLGAARWGAGGTGSFRRLRVWRSWARIGGGRIDRLLQQRGEAMAAALVAVMLVAVCFGAVRP